ncbi:hypothetical protein PX699_24540 [Sphingobium sp. H39-3-25]|uniref:hypothetical protein n=1 Tax=Sphingobium TaxID=165695 RepID=UPI0023B99547|nr:hypothetical protein [Sphingobium arseniciresistens]
MKPSLLALLALLALLVAALGSACGSQSQSGGGAILEKRVGGFTFSPERKWVDTIDGQSAAELVLVFKLGDKEPQPAECSEDPNWECIQVRVVSRAQRSEFDQLRQSGRPAMVASNRSDPPMPSDLAFLGSTNGVATYQSHPDVDGSVFRCWAGEIGQGKAGCQGESLNADFRLIYVFRRDELVHWRAIVEQAHDLVERLPRVAVRRQSRGEQ